MEIPTYNYNLSEDERYITPTDFVKKYKADLEEEKKQKTSRGSSRTNAGRPRRFATGTVATRPTYGLFGEYAGAADNPEIVAPQDIIFDTVVEANGVLATAISELANRVVTAIKENRPVAVIGDKDIFEAGKRGADENKKIVGTTKPQPQF